MPPGDTADVENYHEQRVYKFRKLILNSTESTKYPTLDPADRELLIEFDEEITRERMANNRCGWSHHSGVLGDVYQFATTTNPGSLADSLQDTDAGERALRKITEWIHDQDYSGYTVQSKMSSLRVFAGTICGGEEEMPDHYQNIEPGSFVTEDPAPHPSNIVEYADLLEMVTATDSWRDKALVTTQWGGGFRPRKLWVLQYKQIEFEDNFVKISFKESEEGDKTDTRTVYVYVGSQLLEKWMKEEHPVHDDPDASLNPETFVWTHQNKNELLSYSGFAARFEKLGERAGIAKDHTPQHFRRSAASVLAGQPHISERDLRERFAWSYRSDAPEHYIEANNAATQVNVAMSRGLDVKDLDQRPDTAPVVCPRCGDWTTRGLPECVWCHRNLDDEQATFEQSTPEIRHPDAAGEQRLADLILNEEVTADELRTLRKLEPQIKSEPKLFEQLDELITKADALADVESDGDATYALGPTGVVAWASATASSWASRWARLKHTALRIHPGFEGYPPKGKRLGGLLAGWLAILSVTAAVLSWSGLLGELARGEPMAVLALMIALPLGVWIVNRDLPSVDEAMEAARGTE